MDQILNGVLLREMAILWIKEDCPNFDFHSLMSNANRCAKFEIYCKMDAILAGKPFVEAILKELNLQVKWGFKEGEEIKASRSHMRSIAVITGKVKNLLIAERVVLNVLARCSGVATNAYRMRNMLSGKNKITICGTRKTTPGFRLVEKYGLLVAGVSPHRYDLSSLVMIKDNHIDVCGDRLKDYIDAVRRTCGFTHKIEMECRDLAEVQRASQYNVDIIMMDNFQPEHVVTASKWLKENHPHILVDISGGITSDNITKYDLPTVDYISIGPLVQGYPTVDFSMKFTQFLS